MENKASSLKIIAMASDNYWYCLYDPMTVLILSVLFPELPTGMSSRIFACFRCYVAYCLELRKV